MTWYSGSGVVSGVGVGSDVGAVVLVESESSAADVVDSVDVDAVVSELPPRALIPIAANAAMSAALTMPIMMYMPRFDAGCDAG